MRNISPREYPYPIEQASPQDEVARILINMWDALGDFSTELNFSYMIGEENRYAHFMMISIACQLWRKLRPKMENTTLAPYFAFWIPFINDQRLFIKEGNERSIFFLEDIIDEAFEHLNLTKLG